MKQEKFSYVVESKKSFEETVVSVLKSVEKSGWALFQIYDIRERLAAKGFDQKKLKIIEICSGKYANQFLNKDMLISLCLPCRITVIEDEKTKIAVMKPTIISEFFTDISEKDLEPAEKEVMEIIDNAK